jgi:hypothetical protein
MILQTPPEVETFVIAFNYEIHEMHENGEEEF